MSPNPAGRNRRDVWTIQAEGFPGAHFAVFPTALVEPCIKAGTSAVGCCPACGAGWRRMVERGKPDKQITRGQQAWTAETGQRDSRGGLPLRVATTVGWQPTCSCGLEDVVPATVLDPFSGAGTVGLVAQRLGRRAVLIDLSESYCEMAARRIAGETPVLMGEASYDSRGDHE